MVRLPDTGKGFRKQPIIFLPTPYADDNCDFFNCGKTLVLRTIKLPVWLDWYIGLEGVNFELCLKYNVNYFQIIFSVYNKRCAENNYVCTNSSAFDDFNCLFIQIELNMMHSRVHNVRIYVEVYGLELISKCSCESCWCGIGILHGNFSLLLEMNT